MQRNVTVKSSIDEMIDYHLARLDYFDFIAEHSNDPTANKNFLADRWQKIREGHLAYHRNANSLATQFCLQKVRECLTGDDKELDVYRYLMPGENLTGQENNALTEIILDDDVVDCVNEEKIRIDPEPEPIEYQVFIKRFENKEKELKDFFTDMAIQKDSDKYFSELWHFLNAKQKNILVECLEENRLEKILKLQQNPVSEFNDALNALREEIKLAGGDLANPLAVDVLCKILANKENLTKMTLVTELAHRTAVGVRNPLNVKNIERYEVVAKKIPEPSLSIAAMNFSGLLLLGGMAVLICIATGGVAGIVGGLVVAGAVTSGVFGIGFLYKGLSSWKRSLPNHRIGTAACNFLREAKKRPEQEKARTIPIPVDSNQKKVSPTSPR